jgi:GTP cyclohydrolase I
MPVRNLTNDQLSVIRAATADILGVLIEDKGREGLTATPARVAKAWREWTAGYGVLPADVLKSFADGGENYDEMVVVRNIPFYSTCEHHLAPFFGDATIAYIPDGSVVGLSKLPRLLDVYAKRLQVQERITTEVADALMEHLKPKGCGVVITARHMCMESRGICKRGSETITSALRGVFKEGNVRAEFMALGRK